MCFDDLMIFGEELEVRIESHILVDFGTLDEFWASTGLNFLSFFFLMVCFLAFFWDVFKLHQDAFSREQRRWYRRSDFLRGSRVRRTSMTSGLGSRGQRLSLLQIAIPTSSQ